MLDANPALQDLEGSFFMENTTECFCEFLWSQALAERFEGTDCGGDAGEGKHGECGCRAV
jgi:hypothetical protein